jgi:hypothetical protein
MPRRGRRARQPLARDDDVGVAAPCAVARRGRDDVAAAHALIQYMALFTSRTPVPPERFLFDTELAQRTQERGAVLL